ncbi:hypothetical protein CIK06_03020 [Plantactinospora sp. KBS50]|nr:hypothetical protein CIK06_03020 [Plantactinospora sp. KBS50]
MLVVLAVGMSVAVPVDAVPVGEGFPLSWMWSWLQIDRAWSAVGLLGLPVQAGGTAKNKDHHVPAAATDAGRGAGRAPGRPPGALAPAARPVREVRSGLAGNQPSDRSFDAKTSKRIATAASATSDVYRNRDGSYTRKVYDGPINYRANDGSWRPIDTALVRTGDRYRQRANGPTLSMATLAADPAIASLQVDADHAISYSLAGAASVAAEVDGGKATYHDVLPGTDLELTSMASGVKESLVLHSADVATSWLFPLDVRGLTPQAEADGSVSLLDETGNRLAYMPHGLMWDSKFDPQSGGFAESRGVTYELTSAETGPAIRVSIDQGWLRDPARTFPVTVDPSTTLADYMDTYVRSDNPADHGSEAELQVGTYNSGSSKAYSFLGFNDFGAAYAGARISAASLKIFDSWAYTCTPEPFSVNPITQYWSPSTLTTYPGPSFGASIGSVTANPGAACTNTKGDRSIGTWMTVPLATATLQDWALNKKPNYGLAVTASQSDSYQWKKFTSRNGPSPSLAPYLEITYSWGRRRRWTPSIRRPGTPCRA